MHITHTKQSIDPIFHAATPRHVPGFQDTYFYNSDPRARVLACVDQTEVCDPTGETCWSMIAPIPPKVKVTPAYWLMKWSLENSNVYDAIKFRLGTALLAQQSISQSISEPLSSNHWELEASHMFATSLARIQFDAWAIATGEDHDRPGYVEVTPEEAKGRLCNIVKIKTSEYTNINMAAFIGLPLLAFFIFFLSWDAKVLPRVDLPEGVMIIDVIARSLGDLLAIILVLLYHGILTVRSLIVSTKDKAHRHRRDSSDTEQQPSRNLTTEHA